jgi:EAL domain-containing protein (putative c-di-GMP-specific phosphodiesterase class I)
MFGMDERGTKPSAHHAPGRKLSNLFPANPFDATAAPMPVRRDSLSGLEQIVKAEDLSVVFQPIVDMQSGRIFAYEALVRCQVPQFANPTTLFEQAMARHCCGRLGRMIREVAVPLCAGKPLFLNVHPLELEEHWLVRPDDPMYFHDHDVYLEVTESVPLTHFELCLSVITDIRKRSNIQLVVDDLGAGYSNLRAIADLQPAVVKLDRGLIIGITRESRQQRLVEGVVRLCADLNATVVAEGIETADEFHALRDAGCHYGQGYLFARPGFPLPSVKPDIFTRSG